MPSYAKSTLFLRSLRGRCQAKLIRADDGAYYAIKAPDNPQGGRRILVNEYLGTRVLARLGISVAQTCTVQVTQEFIEANPEMCFHTSTGPARPAAGIYLGSRFEVSPETVAIFDLLPAVLIPKVYNLADFVGALVVDQWFGNADRRQCVFHRLTKVPGGSCVYRAVMIDCGQYLNGREWRLSPSPRTAICYQRAVYRDVCRTDFDRHIEEAQKIGSSTFQTWIDEIPDDWLQRDRPKLEAVLEEVLRVRISHLIDRCMERDMNWFR